MNIEEELNDFSAELLTAREYIPFVERLFTQKAGVWSSVEALCSNIPLIEDRMESLCEYLEGNLVVTWLEYSGGPYDSGYASIIFFEDQLLWSNIAVFNKGFGEITNSTSDT